MMITTLAEELAHEDTYQYDNYTLKATMNHTRLSCLDSGQMQLPGMVKTSVNFKSKISEPYKG